MRTLFLRYYHSVVFIPLLLLSISSFAQPCVPLTPGPISGQANVCNFINTGQQLSYSIDPLQDAISYQWTVPPTCTLVSGQGTTSIEITVGPGFIAAANKQIRVSATFICGTGGLSIFYLKAAVPSTPPAITGPINACPFVLDGTSATYFTHPVRGALSYNWTAPVGATLDHPNPPGPNDTIVLASFDNNFTTSNLLVQSVNSCGASNNRSFKIYRSAATAPGPISGIVNVCPYINTGDQLTYSVDDLPGATDYIWVIPPSLTLVSGQGTASIVVTVGPDFIATANKLIRLSAEFNNCGIGGERFLYLKAQLPSTPKHIEGPTDACPYIDGLTEATYFIHPAAGAASYTWTTQAGATISHPNGAGINDTLVTVVFDNSFVTSPITVQAINNCANGTVRSLSIVRNTQNRPGAISGPTSVCPNTLPSGVEAVYTIDPVTNATSYDWTAPLGTVVTHPNGPGVNDITITVLYPQGFENGSITVTATGPCGTSLPRSLAVAVNKPGTPGVITATEAISCPDREYTYSIPSVPPNAVDLVWGVPAGGNIISGQGSTTITVDYTGGNISGAVTVQATGNCANSAVRELAVELPSCRPFVATRGSASNVPAINQELQFNIFPNPAVRDFSLNVRGAKPGNIQVRVLNMSGMELKRFNMDSNRSNSFGADLRSGIYIVEISQGNSRSIQKLVKL